MDVRDVNNALFVVRYRPHASPHDCGLCDGAISLTAERAHRVITALTFVRINVLIKSPLYPGASPSSFRQPEGVRFASGRERRAAPAAFALIFEIRTPGA